MKRFLIIIFYLILCSRLFSDDGSWNVLFSEKKGNLYSETENPNITLEKEVLKFDGLISGNVEAVFQFKNVTENPIEVEAGFPIEITIDIMIDPLYDKNKKPIMDVYYISSSKYGSDNEHIDLAKFFLGEKLKHAKYTNEDGYSGHSDYYFIEKELESRRVIPVKDFGNKFNFKIKQNGQIINYDFVVVETKIEQYVLKISCHFHHKLSFKPKETKEVVITYTDNCFKGVDNFGYSFANKYEWSYILGTGATWKDKIKKLYFIAQENETSKLPKEFKLIGTQYNKNIYLAENYEPDKNDTINIYNARPNQISQYYLSDIWFTAPVYLDIPKIPYSNNIIYKSCSSYLKENVTIYTEHGVIKGIDYSGLRLFDGIRESVWCEDVKDDGIGEWVEFELLEDVIGIEIQNGFNKSFSHIEGKDIDTYYEKNNRVKILEFVSDSQKINKKIELEDIKDTMQYFDISLPKGVYRVYIRDIYKGTKWQDTCLGEIKFFFRNKNIEKLLAEDEFFKKYF